MTVLSQLDAALALCDDLGLGGQARRSRFAAYRAFRVRYGLSPSEYQRQLRLRAARQALASGAAIADVAAAAGFADQAHLTRWFRRCYGITPGAYRAASGSGHTEVISAK